MVVVADIVGVVDVGSKRTLGHVDAVDGQLIKAQAADGDLGNLRNKIQSESTAQIGGVYGMAEIAHIAIRADESIGKFHDETPFA